MAACLALNVAVKCQCPQGTGAQLRSRRGDGRAAGGRVALLLGFEAGVRGCVR